ncbi:MAG: PAS domain S-box protein [Gammaproteobacteria bacterium]|nr:PAS domain S-box protein [Gammaproteobacteria bacterium]
MLLPVIFGICVLFIQQQTAERVSGALDVEHFSEKVVTDAYALHRLMSDIRAYPAERRPRQQWQSKTHSLRERLHQNGITGEVAVEVFYKMEETFHRLLQLYESFCPDCSDEAVLPTLLSPGQHKALDQMVVTIHAIESDALQLAHLSHTRVETIRAEEARIIRLAILILVIVLTTMVYFISQHIISHIGMLKTGSQRLGDGDLDHRLCFTGNDELADLAHTFDRMADQLLEGSNAQTRLNSQLETLNQELEQRAVKLQESEDKFRSISDSAQDAIILLGSAGDIQYWNAAAERIFGYSMSEAVGKDLHQLIVPGHYDQAHAAGWQYFTETGEGAVVGNVTEFSALRRDGSEFPVELSISSFKLQAQWQAVGIIRDISERKQSERLINESNIQIEQAHREWIDAFDSVQDPIFLHDAEGRVMRANCAYAEQAGLSFKEIIGRFYWDCFPKGEGPLRTCSLVAESADIDEFDDEFTLENGESYLSRGYAIREEDGTYRYSIHILENTTFQRQAKQALKESESRFRDLFEEAPLPYQSLDEEGRVIEVNRAWEELFGYGRADVIGHLFQEYLSTSSREQFHDSRHICVTLQEGESTELEVRCKDGSERIIATRGRLSYDPDGKMTVSHCILTDITERKRAEASLLLKDQVFESSLSGISTSDVNGLLTTVNQAFVKLWGYDTGEEVLGRAIPEFLFSEDEAIEILTGLNTEGKWEGEYTALRKDGSTFVAYGLATPLKDVAGNITGYQSSVLDITERKEDARHLFSLNQMLQTSRDCNEALVRATDEKALIQQVCNILAAHGDFSVVWVGLSGADGTVEHTTTATHLENRETIDKLTTLNTNWQLEDGPYPGGEAVKSGQIQIIHDFDTDATYSSYRQKIVDLGCPSHVALPLQNQGESLGLLMVYSDKVNVFNQQQTDLLEELSNDLAYGIASLRMQIERNRMGERLERNLLQTVQAIARTLETRDPYTAGHQRRVSELAVAIAGEMELSEQIIAGIRFGSIIHDIGKIHIPAEILSRPGRLTDMEFGIIKSHPQVGYDIIREIDFPWPVADIVHQHHERLDGSGYPQGLKEDEITLEAKIVAVADVVEAMSSHRPYRPGLGIERALEEIKMNREKFYDPDVADICIELFSSNRFSFSDSNP